MAVTPLGELIEECRTRFRDQHGVDLSYADIARRGGNVITRGRVQQMAKDPLSGMPKAETLRALAAGLGVLDEVVVERALASTGYGDYGVAVRAGRPALERDRRAQDTDAEAGDPPAPDEP